MVSVFYINMKIYIQRCHVQMRFAEEIQAEQEEVTVLPRVTVYGQLLCRDAL